MFGWTKGHLELWIPLYEEGLQIYLKLNSGAERHQDTIPMPISQTCSTFWGIKQSFIIKELFDYFNTLKLYSGYIVNCLPFAGTSFRKGWGELYISGSLELTFSLKRFSYFFFIAVTMKINCKKSELIDKNLYYLETVTKWINCLRYSSLRCHLIRIQYKEAPLTTLSVNYLPK